MNPRKPRYTPVPKVTPQTLPRLRMIVEVLAGTTTVSAAARTLGLSRNHFQTLLHRGIGALAQAVMVHRGGRPAHPPGMAQLRAELQRVQRENRRLQRQVETTERLLKVGSALLQGRLQSGRAREPRRRATRRSGGREDGEPEGRRAQLLAEANAMRELKLTAPLVAAVVGVGASTLRRWRARQRRGWSLATTVTTRPPGNPGATRAAALLVRQLHGLVGAESLSHSAGLSRRAAARIKALTLTRMERERKAALRQVTVTAPGVVRGMDALQFPGIDAGRYALISADGAVPYRTHVEVGSHYDGEFAARALEADLAENGAPLVYRLDRARAHDAPRARAVLAAHRVLLLHGPPHYPRYYGQLERQNREHRAWLRAAPPTDVTELDACLRELLRAVNDLWRRRSLDWQTATEAWRDRPSLSLDRQALGDEVQARTRAIARTLKLRGHPADLAERLAIEQTLTRLGYLRQVVGGWC